MSNFKDVAHLAEGQVKSERLRAELSTRPLRLAFVIRDDLSLDHLLQILDYNSVIWGGYHNCLIPTNGEEIEQDWWINLTRCRPDKVVFCGDKGEQVVSSELLETVQDEIQPFSLHIWNEWEKDSIELHKTGRQDRIGSIPVLYLLQYLVDNLRGPVEQGKSNVRIPRVAPDCPLRTCIAAQVGIAKGMYEEGYVKSLKAEYVDFESSDLGEHLARLAEFNVNDRLSPLDFTDRYLRRTIAFESSNRERPEGLSIVLLDKNWVQDVCVFWNLRHAISLSGFGKQYQYQELILPIGHLRSPQNLRSLGSALKAGGPWHSHKVTLLSKSADRRRVRRLADRLRRELPAGIKVAVLFDVPWIADSRLYNTSERDEILIEDGFFSFKALQPEFGDYVRAGQWVVDVDIKDRFNRGHEFPLSPRLNHLLCCSPSDSRVRWGYRARYARGRLALRVDRHTGFTGGCLPKASNVFQPVFKSNGFDTTLSDKHPYTEGFLALLGSFSDVKLLEKAGVRELLWHMQSGNAYTLGDMASILKLGRGEGESVAAKLVQKRVLLRGMCFRCAACGLLRWYPLNQIRETMQCAGCLKMIQPPVGAPVSYKLNELVARAVGQGSIPVLLTHRFFSARTDKHTLSLFGLEVTRKDRPVDVDFVTTYQGHLLLAECKEFKNGANQREVKNAVKQLSDLVRVARAIRSPIAFLSTLLPETPPELAEQVLRLNRQRKVAVHLVSLREMKLVDLHNPTETIDFGKVNLFYPPEV